LSFDKVVSDYGASAKNKLSGPGAREALIRGPVSGFVEAIGQLHGLNVSSRDEVTELNGSVRPDYAIRVDGVITGHLELKAPGVSLDPTTYGKTTHNYQQWQRLKELPNLLHTNGIEWRLWRYGELVDVPVHVHATDLARQGSGLTAPVRLEHALLNFLRWQPVPITSVAKLVDAIAPLARMLREEVKLTLKAERKAVAAGSAADEQPFLGMARDWRSMLFPGATDAGFADGYAQTVTFALLLAMSDGIDLASTSIYEVAVSLEAHHTLMGRALRLLTEHVRNTPTWVAVEVIGRVLSAVDWPRLSGNSADLYLHLYEHFLSSYDSDLRRMSGSYYTPTEIVDGMVRLSEEVLRTHFGREEGLRNPNVSIIDPAMGTGTYPLSILRRIAENAAAQYGPGAAPEAVSSAVERLYGLELQSGPYSVAELRITTLLQDIGARLPQHGLNLYIADTLEDPWVSASGNLSYAVQLVARQRAAANEMKRERNIHLCIGNPPYKDHAGGMGGWIESGIDSTTGASPLDAFRLPGNGRHERHLSNLYVYFWRWAFWKVFESTSRTDERDGGNGIATFITATGYLAGPGFKGMRKYIRERCSHAWIINLTPEGLQPPSANSVFNIETPVAIGLFIRTEGTNATVPAEIAYIDLHGTRTEKFEQLNELHFEDPRWRWVRSGWTDPFTPAASSEWDEYPALDDLLPWVAPGILTGRTWIYDPSPDTLEARLRELIYETDRPKKSALLVESGNINLDAGRVPLPGADTEEETQTPMMDVQFVSEPKIIRVGYRALERQWLLADSRLMMRPSPTLWHGRIDEQVFTVELHSEHPRSGPALVFSSLIPDVHHFRGSGGGRVIPMLHPDGSANVAPGLVDALSTFLGPGIMACDVIAYIAGISAHAGFVELFSDELRTPGLRIPITANRSLWNAEVELGKEVIWLQTYGERGKHRSGAATLRTLPVETPHPS
jgi:hypothetical protein